MTPEERVAHYNALFGDRAPLYEHGGRIYGVWAGGRNYKGNGYYGAYPPYYLRRVAALFPDKRCVLHAPAGMVKKGAFALAEEITIDVRDDLGVDYVCDVQELSLHVPGGTVDLILADPPYSAKHAERYGTGMPNRGRVIKEMAKVLRPGGHLVWLDTKWPHYSNKYLSLAGMIGLWRSTNHDVRGVTIFVKPDRV